jgi:hypothetical protein
VNITAKIPQDTSEGFCEEAPDELKDLVRKHQVCWMVWPENLVLDAAKAKKVQIGFALDLLGTHDHPSHNPFPGCDECLKVWRDLKHIARWILPKEIRPSLYEIGPFRPAISYSPQRDRREDVTLTIKILHREGFDAPVDPCETRCLHEMQKKLVLLGARETRWSR